MQVVYLLICVIFSKEVYDVSFSYTLFSAEEGAPLHTIQISWLWVTVVSVLVMVLFLGFWNH